MTVEPPENGSVELRVLWRGLEDSPILLTNQYVLQSHQDSIILTMGQLELPILLGEAEDRIAQARKLPYIPIATIGRFAFTRARLVELSNAIREHLEKFDSAQEG